MNKGRLLLWVFLFVGMLFPGCSGAQMMAGVSKTIITPEEEIWLAGYAARDKPSEGKLHDLYAKAMALRDPQGNHVVFVSTDLISIPLGLSQRIAKYALEQHSIPRANLMLTASHTHSGPVLRDNLKEMYGLPEDQWQVVMEYMEELEEKLKQTIDEALAVMQPVRLYRGCGEADFAMNRREYTLDGVRIGVNPIAPVDNDVPVLKVVDERGALMAILFGYACHNTTLDGYEINGDYAGFAQEELEKQHPDVVAMFFSGCGGDINPHPRREIAHARQHGRSLALSVEEVLSGAMKPVEGVMSARFSNVDLPLTSAPTEEELQEQLESDHIHIKRRARNLQQTLEEEGKIPEEYSYPVQTWSIGDDWNIIALGGEVVVDYSLRLKHELGEDTTWVVAYANDVCCYIPSLRVLREGGYEADTSMIYYGFHGPWDEPVEKLIFEEVHQQIESYK